MSKEKRRVPKLRFPGFTEDWEQRKLGEYANFRRGSFPQPYGNKEWYDGVDSAPFVQVVDVGDNLSLVDCTKQRISKLAQPMSVYAEKGSVLVTLQGSIGRVAVSQYDAFIDRTILIFQGYKYKTNPYFWAYIIKGKFSEEALKAPGGTIKTITKEALSNFIILYPKFSEQEQIGSFFEKLDKLITLHQRKLNNLKLKKKALLQKLFPKNGERYPELRFPGFTDAWEQRKLSEVVAINPKTELPDEFKYVDLESVVGTNLLGFQVIKKENAPSRAQRLASYGDVFYQTVRPYQRNNYLFENVDKDMVFSTGYAQLRSRLDSYFLLTLVQNDNFVKVVLDNCTGTSYPAINGRELGKITVQIPPNEVEANQIGKVFRGIDKSITLHQRKSDHLKLQKKALLQQMFV